MTQHHPLKVGSLLLAEPFMTDMNFRSAAILLCDHHPDGTMGFILNKSLNMNINELLPDFPEMEADVFYGGPVQTDTLHYLHNVGDLLEESVRICQGVYFGGDFEKLKFLIKSGLIESKNVRFFIGYSGWDKGQLKEEITDGSWITSLMSSNLLFKTHPFKVWEEALTNLGTTYEIISQMKGTEFQN
jgi:putative transcriptional regulator